MKWGAMKWGPYLCLALASADFTDTEINEILVRHNEIRTNVDPTAANMELMQWDPVIEQNAQNWADTCQWGHSPNSERGADTTGGKYSYLGENIYVKSKGAGYAAGAVDSWGNEVEDYDYASGSCSGVCGHYTQIVWDDSAFLGCAHKFCTSMSGLGFCTSYGGCEYVVCQYGPGGNYPRKPYAQGDSCTDCPANLNQCSNNMCADDGAPAPAPVPGPSPATPAPTPTPNNPAPAPAPSPSGTPNTAPVSAGDCAEASGGTCGLWGSNACQCWCDDTCHFFGDCCHDICEACGKNCPPGPAPAPGPSPAPSPSDVPSTPAPTPAPTPVPGPGSCGDGHCRGVGSDGKCYCDMECAAYGDCCEDACDQCGYCGVTLSFYLDLTSASELDQPTLNAIADEVVDVLGVDSSEVSVVIASSADQVLPKDKTKDKTKDTSIDTSLIITVSGFADNAAASSAGDVLDEAVSDGTIKAALLPNPVLGSKAAFTSDGYDTSMVSQENMLGQEALGLEGNALKSGELIVLTRDATGQHGRAVLASPFASNLGLSGGANAELSFTLKIGGSPILGNTGRLPYSLKMYRGLGHLPPPQTPSMQLSHCEGKAFGVHVGASRECLGPDPSLATCQGYGFFFITEELDGNEPGIYAVEDGETKDWSQDIGIFADRVSQVKITWSPYGNTHTRVQMFLDNMPILDPIVFKSAENSPEASLRSTASGEETLVFEALTGDSCTQEHIITNVKMTSDNAAAKAAGTQSDESRSNDEGRPTLAEGSLDLWGDQMRARLGDNRVEDHPWINSGAVVSITIFVALIFTVMKTVGSRRRYNYLAANGEGNLLNLRDMHS